MVLTRCLFAVALDEVGFEIQCLLLLSPFVQPCQELVTRCSQFSNYMSPFNYKLPKCINKDVVKAASSFVVRREDAKSADDSGLGVELKGLNSRQGCRYLASKAYMLNMEVKWRMLM